jgi:hypothetical protein
MSSRMEVLLWAKRICARRSAEAHLMLEVSADASLEVAQQAFHAIARSAHPDLHRTTASADELELITSAFALVAAAYQQFRATRLATTKMASLRDLRPEPKSSSAQRSEVGPAPGVLVPETTTTNTPASQMSARAAIHYRKAELSLRRGDLPAGILHIKMAIAADPQSKFLRTALTQIEAELAKKP